MAQRRIARTQQRSQSHSQLSTTTTTTTTDNTNASRDRLLDFMTQKDREHSQLIQEIFLDQDRLRRDLRKMALDNQRLELLAGEMRREVQSKDLFISQLELKLSGDEARIAQLLKRKADSEHSQLQLKQSAERLEQRLRRQGEKREQLRDNYKTKARQYAQDKFDMSHLAEVEMQLEQRERQVRQLCDIVEIDGDGGGRFVGEKTTATERIKQEVVRTTLGRTRQFETEVDQMSVSSAATFTIVDNNAESSSDSTLGFESLSRRGHHRVKGAAAAAERPPTVVAESSTPQDDSPVVVEQEASPTTTPTNSPGSPSKGRLRSGVESTWRQLSAKVRRQRPHN